MSFQNAKAFLSPDFIIRAAAQPWELEGVRKLRHQVFVQEQAIFDRDDRDDIDDVALPLAAISTYASEADQVVGTVRIHEESPRIWRGSRLAVAHSHRRMGRLGAELIHLAVSTAHGCGCDQFLAQVQMQNVTLFGACAGCLCAKLRCMVFHIWRCRRTLLSTRLFQTHLLVGKRSARAGRCEDERQRFSPHYGS